MGVFWVELELNFRSMINDLGDCYYQKHERLKKLKHKEQFVLFRPE